MLAPEPRDLDPDSTVKLTAEDVELVDQVPQPEWPCASIDASIDSPIEREDTLRIERPALGSGRTSGFGPIFVVIVACSVSSAVSLVAWLFVDSRVRAELARPAERARATEEIAAPLVPPRPPSEVTLTLPTVEIESK